MFYRYRCACCNHVVSSEMKECPECGSHHIKSPIHLWVFCLITCLSVVFIFTVINLYVKDYGDVPRAKSIFEVINKN